MKKIASFLICTILISSLPAFAAQSEPQITSLSTETIIPGETILTITGVDFVSTFNSTENEICFGADNCYDATGLNDYLQEWSDTQIQLLVPPDIPTDSNPILLRAYFSSPPAYDYIESAGTYTVQLPPEPVTATTTISPVYSGTIFDENEDGVGDNTGSDFYEGGQPMVGIGEYGDWATSNARTNAEYDLSSLAGKTITAATLKAGAWYANNEALTVSWYYNEGDGVRSVEDYHQEATFITSVESDGSTYPLSVDVKDELQTLVNAQASYIGFRGERSAGTGAVGWYEPINLEVTYIVEEEPPAEEPPVEEPPAEEPPAEEPPVEEPPAEEPPAEEPPAEEPPPAIPEITSISPNVLIPGVTMVTITGKGFGDEYVKGYSQICFGEECITDGTLPFYFPEWSDTEITIKTPSFINEKESGTIGLRVYFPASGVYAFVDSPQYTIKHRPVIGTYYRQMDQRGTYTYEGHHFGAAPGKIVINNLECEIVSWSDTAVTFVVPENALSGDVYIESAEGAASSTVYAIIIPTKVYTDDEYSEFQWHLGALNMEQAWGITQGSSDVIVAVVDSGVDIAHEDLAHAIWVNEDEIAGNGIDDDNNGYIDDINGWDFVLDTNAVGPRGPHGTMVASLIAAKKGNGVGIAGIAPNIKIMPLNVTDFDEVSVSIDGAIMATKYAVDNGADIVNMSFVGPDTAYYEDIMQYAYDNNVLVVAAAGNDSLNLDSTPQGPVCVDLGVNAVFGVAATNESNIRSYFSNYGSSCIDMSAPGEFLSVALPSNLGYYGTGDGTSFASPIVAGVGALVKSKHPDWNVAEIKQVIRNTAKNIDAVNTSYSGKLGKGIPDAYAALQASKPDVSYNYNPTQEIVIVETGAVIDLKPPEVKPIEEAPEPIKDESIEKNQEDVVKKDTAYTPGPVIEATPISVDNITASFPDVKDHKYEAAIGYLENKDIVHGHPDGSFKPDDTINRAEFTKIVLNTFVEEESYGDNCFPDVKEEWFAPFVCSAKRLEILHGYIDGTFKPDQSVSTVEALKIILETKGIEIDTSPVGDWFSPYVVYAINTNLDFILYENTFHQPLTRAQAAEMIYRLETG